MTEYVLYKRGEEIVEYVDDPYGSWPQTVGYKKEMVMEFEASSDEEAIKFLIEEFGKRHVWAGFTLIKGGRWSNDVVPLP